MTARSTAAALSAAWPGAVAAQAQEVTLHMGHDNQADHSGQVAGEGVRAPGVRGHGRRR